jgi:hypothetical protein
MTVVWSVAEGLGIGRLGVGLCGRRVAEVA